MKPSHFIALNDNLFTVLTQIKPADSYNMADLARSLELYGPLSGLESILPFQTHVDVRFQNIGTTVMHLQRMITVRPFPPFN